VASAFAVSETLFLTKAECAGQNTRHRAWLKRLSTNTGLESWRPKKKHRLATVKVIQSLDNQFKICTETGGLVKFQHNPKLPVWKASNWRSWPKIIGCIDQGSDGFSAAHAMGRKLQLNLEMSYDWCHGACRDMECAFRATGQWSLMLLFLVILNLPHGPERDEGFIFTQLVESLQHMLENQTPAEFQLFQSRAPSILEEMGELVEIDEGEQPIDALWRYLKETAPYEKAKYRAKKCQFMGWSRRLAEFLPSWTLTRFRCEYIGLELDMFDHKMFKKDIVVKKDVLAAAEDVTTTAISAVPLEDKVLKSACKNAVVVAVCVLERDHYKRKLSIMCHIPSPLVAWEGRAAKEMNSSTANQAWLASQLGSNFLEHQVEILKGLENHDTLRSTGFFSFEGLADVELDAFLVGDNEYAAFAGSLCLHLAAQRQRQ